MRKRNAPASSLSDSLARFVACLLGAVAFLLVAGSLAAAERSVQIGGEERWELTDRSERLVLEPGRGGYLDLTVEPFSYEPSSSTELLLGFDSLPLRDAVGSYSVRASDGSTPELTHTVQRTGTGALLIDGPEDRLELVPGPQAAFAPGVEWASFTIEFWFYPVALSEGDTILAWRAREGAGLDFRRQELAIEVVRGAISARFDNFFIRPNGSGVSVELHGTDRLIPRTWAHHLVRFDATTGLLEYLVDGQPVDVTYVSASGTQDGSVFFPRIATHPEEGLILADGPVGAMDGLRLERRFVGETDRPFLPPRGGVFVSDSIDLGSPGARLTSVDAAFDAPGLSDVLLYYRMTNLRADEPAAAAPTGDWTPIRPGDPIRDAYGRFVQVRAELYPDTRADTPPRLSDITIAWEPDPPPLPPTALRATPRDGAVVLEWAPVQDPDIDGHLVYYGDQSGRYFGTGSDQGPSPVDVGPANAVTIDGLSNGTLYFFAVQAYSDRSSAGVRGSRANELSTEVAARPAKVYR